MRFQAGTPEFPQQSRCDVDREGLAAPASDQLSESGVGKSSCRREQQAMTARAGLRFSLEHRHQRDHAALSILRVAETIRRQPSPDRAA